MGRTTTTSTSSTPSAQIQISSAGNNNNISPINPRPVITQVVNTPPTVTPTTPTPTPARPTTPAPSQDQFFIPTVTVANRNTQSSVQPATNVFIPTPSPTSSPQVIPSEDCTTQLNTYWTGYRCACRVGFVLANGLCVVSQPSNVVFRPAEFIYKISQLYRQRPTETCKKANEIFNGQFCDCATGFYRESNGNCDSNDNRPTPTPTPRPDDNCGPNSFRNPLGRCVCSNGFVFSNGRCVSSDGSNCPPYSIPNGR